MIRFLAALTFAGLLGLAVATVGLKTASLRARARIEGLALAVKARRFELLHAERAFAAATGRDVLADRLRAMLGRGGEG